MAFTILLAVVVLPFGIGWWVGHPLFAAAVFLALSLTVALGAASRGDEGDPALGLALSLAVSSLSAAAGGYARERRRAALRRKQ